MEKRINHLSQSTDDVRVYVSTYNRYNNGSLKGYWLDIASFYDAEEFYDKLADNKLNNENIPDILRDCFDYNKWYFYCRMKYKETKNYLFVA